MNFLIKINFSDSIFLNVNTFIYDDNTYAIELYLTPETDLKEILSKKNFLSLLEKELNALKIDCNLFQNSISSIENLIKEDIDVLKSCSDFTIFPTNEMKKFIERNPILKEYKLYLDGEYSINHDNFDVIENLFGEYNNIYLYIDGNDEEVSIQEYKKTLDAIDKIVNKIKKYNLSPLEQIMYAYDLVRDRVYNSEGEFEKETISRDLTQVLLGDKIVCVGFANIFEKVLNNLGIKSRMYSIKNSDNKKHGHRRNIAYVKDDKYKINGIYYFDTTWDSKRSINDNSYLKSYRFFARTKRDVDVYSIKYTDRTFEGFNIDMIFEFEKIVNEQGIKKIPKKMIHTINEISEFIDDCELINPLILIDIPNMPSFIMDSFNKSDVISKLYQYENLLFKEEINPLILLSALYEVRKIEFYEDSGKYPFSYEDIKTTIINSDWGISSFEMVLSLIISKKLREKRANEVLEDYLKDNDLRKNIECVKLTKVLKKSVETKTLNK